MGLATLIFTLTEYGELHIEKRDGGFDVWLTQTPYTAHIFNVNLWQALSDLLDYRQSHMRN